MIGPFTSAGVNASSTTAVIGKSRFVSFVD
jgi:hypothetical protein